ncbi:MAG TPA: serine/threonine protein kinase [Polyangiaceae bacterium]|nr:serine/threonine protein kinase [Polyangiaceae bacterium]
MTFPAARSSRRASSARAPVLALLLFSAVAVGCGLPFHAATPPGFVELPEPKQYDYRATTADGVVIAVRAIEHEPQGELGFWVTAIQQEVRERKGYALLESRDVKTGQGLTGKQLRFGYDEGKKPHLYYVTLLLTKANLFLIEAGGQKERMTQHAAGIDSVVQSFEAK